MLDLTDLSGFGAHFERPPQQPIVYPLSQLDFDAYAALGSPVLPSSVEIHIFDGVILGSSSSSRAALFLTQQWPAGSIIRVVFYGTGRIQGRGGNGGAGWISAAGSGGNRHQAGGGGGGQGQLPGSGGDGWTDGTSGTPDINGSFGAGTGANPQPGPAARTATPGTGGGPAIELQAGFGGTLVFALQTGASGRIWGGGGGGGGGGRLANQASFGGSGGVKGNAGYPGSGNGVASEAPGAGGAAGEAIKLNGGSVTWSPAISSFDVRGTVA